MLSQYLLSDFNISFRLCLFMNVAVRLCFQASFYHSVTNIKFSAGVAIQVVMFNVGEKFRKFSDLMR